MNFEKDGYCVFPRHVEKNKLESLRVVIERFHQAWVVANGQFYREKAVNSAYLTGKKYLREGERQVLFEFIGSHHLMEIVNSIMGDSVAFMNTQLFFDPVNSTQKNYWHRDPQYHLSLEEQKKSLSGPSVVHFRIPLVDEPGVELIPGTHKRWDSESELNVRLEREGHQNHEALSSGVRVRLNAGDLLAFSANMIHRGLYGMGRMSLDILFCEPDPQLMQWVDDDTLPDFMAMQKMENASAFKRTRELKMR